HRAGVVHRDVTGRNVLIDESDADHCVLIDFGHAADARAPRLAVGSPGRLTQPDEIPGAAGAMPPEQVRAEPADPRMDVFAFGVLLYELLTATHPFTAFQDRELYIRLQRKDQLAVPKIDRRAFGDIPEGLAALVENCTRLDPLRRPTMAEVVQRLDAAVAAMG